MTTASLLLQIKSALGPAVSPNLTTSSKTSDLFEAYVFTLVVEAAKIEGAKVTYNDVYGNVPSNFVFRTSPGYIFSQAQAYCHAVIELPNVPALEAHIGVRVIGKSKVLHECDVAIIEQSEAETCRQRFVPPRSSKVLLGVECKFYSTAIPLNLARAFIGLTSDLSFHRIVLVTNTQSESAEKLLSRRDKLWEHQVTPSSNTAVLRLRHKFQEGFQHWMAR